MKFILRITLVILTNIALVAQVYSEPKNISLSVKPNRCITLNQGQSCYQKLLFTWSTPETGEYCLYQGVNANELICWQGNQIHSFALDFESEQNQYYFIQSKESPEVLAKVQVKVAWIYKSRRGKTSNWRLF